MSDQRERWTVKQRESARRLQIRRQRERMKLCLGCGKRPMKFGRVRCDECLDYCKAKTAEQYKKQIAQGICGTTGCKNEQSAGHTLCDSHLAKLRDRATERKQRQIARGLCIHSCGRLVEFPPRTACLTCMSKISERCGNGQIPIFVQKMIRDGLAEYRRIERNEYIKSQIYLISEPERQVITLRYQLDDHTKRDRTLTSVGLEVGVTRERVRQIHDKAMVRMLMFRAESELPVQLQPIRKKMEKYPERLDQRNKARKQASYAIKRGILQRQPCQVCGTNENIEAHHHDYSKPLDIHWLCGKCHNEEHKQQQAA